MTVSSCHAPGCPVDTPMPGLGLLALPEKRRKPDLGGCLAEKGSEILSTESGRGAQALHTQWGPCVFSVGRLGCAWLPALSVRIASPWVSGGYSVSFNAGSSWGVRSLCWEAVRGSCGSSHWH